MSSIKFISTIHSLPQTNLHVVSSGSGSPLILLPATFSDVENWKAWIAFFAQRYHTYFFEIPGHGLSTPYPDGYSRHKLAQTLKDLTQDLKLDELSLAAASFGGLTLTQVIPELHSQLKQIILLAPYVSHHQFNHLGMKKHFFHWLDSILLPPPSQKILLKSLTYKKNLIIVEKIINLAKNSFPFDDALKHKLAHLPPQTLDTLLNQIKEVFTYEYIPPKTMYEIPCFFGMSVNDPLLNYDVTLQILSRTFAHMRVENRDLPYHQPPKPYTLEELNRLYGFLLE